MRPQEAVPAGPAGALVAPAVPRRRRLGDWFEISQTRADKRERTRNNHASRASAGRALATDLVDLPGISPGGISPQPITEAILGTFMNSKRSRRKPDLFSLLLIVVVVGMSVTLAYQINVYYGGGSVPIAKQAPPAGGVGG